MVNNGDTPYRKKGDGSARLEHASRDVWRLVGAFRLWWQLLILDSRFLKLYIGFFIEGFL